MLNISKIVAIAVKMKNKDKLNFGFFFNCKASAITLNIINYK